jgi:hypothetical protein
MEGEGGRRTGFPGAQKAGYDGDGYHCEFEGLDESSTSSIPVSHSHQRKKLSSILKASYR